MLSRGVFDAVYCGQSSVEFGRTYPAKGDTKGYHIIMRRFVPQLGDVVPVAVCFSRIREETADVHRFPLYEGILECIVGCIALGHVTLNRKLGCLGSGVGFPPTAGILIAPINGIRRHFEISLCLAPDCRPFRCGLSGSLTKIQIHDTIFALKTMLRVCHSGSYFIRHILPPLHPNFCFISDEARPRSASDCPELHFRDGSVLDHIVKRVICRQCFSHIHGHILYPMLRGRINEINGKRDNGHVGPFGCVHEFHLARCHSSCWHIRDSCPLEFFHPCELRKLLFQVASDLLCQLREIETALVHAPRSSSSSFSSSARKSALRIFPRRSSTRDA
nr:MAG TPA: hypothetical protein [Caudoviricetes sp.]